MSEIQPQWLYTIRWRLMLIVAASLALTGAALFFGYFLAGTLQQTKYAAAPINWIIEHAGSGRVMIIAGILLFPITFFVASRRLVRDLREINTALQEISAGRFGHVIKVKSKDELSTVAESLNQISGEWDRDLEQIMQSLEKIANGQFDHQIPEMSGNKWGEVALSINRMSMQLKHSIEEERKAEKTKNDLITGVSHDLRTPLTSILGFLEVIEKDRYQDEVEMRYYINIAYEKSLALRRLIDELFEYTRINNGMPLELSELHVGGLLGQLTEEFVPLTEHAGMEIRMNLQEGDFKIQADGGLLVRAYENIIANAIQYGQKGKYIDIHIARDEELLVVQIQNYGEPIPEKDLPFIFDRFYRADSSRSKQTGGTGLGLAITKSIIEVHGGSITAHSSKKATVFDIRLPIVGLDQVPADTGHEDIQATEVRDENVYPEMKTIPLPQQRSAKTQKTSSRQRNLFRSGAAAIPMIVLLIGAVILFSVEDSFTSELMAKPNAESTASSDPAPSQIADNQPITLSTGKTDKEFTLLVHDYTFDEKRIVIRYSMKYNPSVIDKSQPEIKSITPNFQLDDSTQQAVPGINPTDTGMKLHKNGTILYTFEGPPPPDKFTLTVNVKSLLVVDEQGGERTLIGDWSFQMPVERNYARGANGQSSPLRVLE